MTIWAARIGESFTVFTVMVLCLNALVFYAITIVDSCQNDIKLPRASVNRTKTGGKKKKVQLGK